MSVVPCFTVPAESIALTRRLAPRSAAPRAADLHGILSLFEAVQQHGDGAVLRATREHDGVALAELGVDPREVAAAMMALPAELRGAIEVALQHVLEVNARLLPADGSDEVRPGTCVGERYRPLDSVAVYVPTRKGPLISTALMLIGAGEGANVTNLALDLLAEAEHGKDSSALLVTPSRDLANSVRAALERQMASLPAARREVVEWVFGDEGLGALVVAPWDDAVELLNRFAPEHLMLVGPDAEARAPRIRHAGELLLGAHSPFAAANYAIGVSAVLPTNGFARSHSAVTALDFLRLSTTARLEPSALEALGPTIVTLATAEGLPCHARSITERAAQ